FNHAPSSGSGLIRTVTFGPSFPAPDTDSSTRSALATSSARYSASRLGSVALTERCWLSVRVRTAAMSPPNSPSSVNTLTPSLGKFALLRNPHDQRGEANQQDHRCFARKRFSGRLHFCALPSWDGWLSDRAIQSWR